MDCRCALPAAQSMALAGISQLHVLRAKQERDAPMRVTLLIPTTRYRTVSVVSLTAARAACAIRSATGCGCET
jgi:hypothetical protein